ncbi:hypothetical protein DFH07DRAFT_767761 [Mycena maculata]|uniref:Uncharacterized protein n=1 Tax=Mycena maculata TaxID=230809 RepID=A0AAD7JXZ1_9AGAR|nr:hypothetical protein DFH07DRAFT_767761 [Mycena maculata]
MESNIQTTGYVFLLGRRQAESHFRPSSGQGLTESWEIALVVILFFLLTGVLGTVIWHSRRTRRRRRIARLLDAEAATAEMRERTTPWADFSQDASLAKPQPVVLTTKI